MTEVLGLRKNASIFHQHDQEKNPKPIHIKNPEAAKVSLQNESALVFPGERASPSYEPDRAALPAVAANTEPGQGADVEQLMLAPCSDHPEEEVSDVGNVRAA